MTSGTVNVVSDGDYFYGGLFNEIFNYAPIVQKGLLVSTKEEGARSRSITS